jgi:mitochondrial division protein 1
MASAAYEQILVRYFETTRALVEAPDTEPRTTDARCIGTEGFKRVSEEVVENLTDHAAHTDPTADAMVRLLARQARTLITIHNDLASNKGTININQDLLKRRIADLISISSSKFYAYRYDLLPVIWRQIYTDACILDSFSLIVPPLIIDSILPDKLLDLVVEKLDRALITAGGGGRQEWLEETLRILEVAWTANGEHERPIKRQRHDTSTQYFSNYQPHGHPKLSPIRECPRHSGWTIPQFEDYMNCDNGEPRPVVFTDLITDWPALADRPWKDPGYLLSKTFGGRRLVPVEIGRSYVDEGWGQELIQFREFLARYVTGETEGIGYLAQHNLFQQIPSLRNDISIPDFCWVDVPPHPTTPSLNQPPVDMPQLNAWFGPARTITPLHTDGYHNLLCQVVGTKYIRLYPPRATYAMRPRASEHGVDMSNTSGLDVGVLEEWDEKPKDMNEEDAQKMREELEGIEYWECILEPGDTLVIPIGWWHYVRSLSVSFSVSFWWN